jgi:hypothetical protein
MKISLRNLVPLCSTRMVRARYAGQLSRNPLYSTLYIGFGYIVLRHLVPSCGVEWMAAGVES